jgi:activator of HSP90 ATPase
MGILGGAGEFKVTEIKDFKGESSINIRKGKKIVSYDYSFKLKWECSIFDGDKNKMGTIAGEYELPEVSNDVEDDGEDWQVKPSFG